MLTINTRNDKLAAAQVDFSSRGMLEGTCLGETLQTLIRELGSNVTSDNNNNNNNNNNEQNGPDGNGEGGPDGNGEGGADLDIGHNGDEDNGSPGPVDGPPILSEVILAHKRGIVFCSICYIGDPD